MIRLYRRTRAAELVRDSLIRPEDTTDNRCPVILLEGAEGSGRSEFLRAIETEVRGGLPCARVDLRSFETQFDGAAFPELLARLAFDLAKDRGQYGSMRFPRLILGLLMTNLETDWSKPRFDRRQARAEARRVLRSQRGVDKVTDLLKRASEGSLSEVKVPSPVLGMIGDLLGLAVEGLSSWSPLRRYILGPYQQWYADPDGRDRPGGRPQGHKAIDELVNVNQWANSAEPGTHDELNRLLWKAFLADLRDNFRRGRRSREWPANCLVLLDNADSGLGIQFFTELNRLQWRGERDPLTIVATGGPDWGALLPDDPDWPLIWNADSPDSEQIPPAYWVRYPLPDFTTSLPAQRPRNSRDRTPVIDGLAEPVIPAGSRRAKYRRARVRRRRLALTLTAVLALGGMGVGTYAYVQHQRQICEGLPDTETAEFSLSMTNGECVGWTVEQDYAFSSDIKDIVTRITDQNRQIRQQWENPEPGKAKRRYVRIAVLMPMTSAAGSTIPPLPIRHALEGIHTAQVRVNDQALADFRPANSLSVQVVLANEGAFKHHWTRVTEQLGGMTGGDHPLLAVVGMGASTDETREAAEKLGEDHKLASIGGVTSSSDMLGEYFFKVTPSNADYVRALDRYLGARLGRNQKEGLLIQDINSDNYVRTLGQEMMNAFRGQYNLPNRIRKFTGTKHPTVGTANFGPIADAICDYDSEVVFYAGRERDLPELITAMAGSPCKHDRPRYIATGTTGLGRTQGDPAVVDKLREARITVLDASATDATEWNQRSAANGTPAGYTAFLDYHHRMGFRQEDLTDGYVIMHHDALAAAVTAVRLAAESQPRLPSPGDVFLQLSNLRNTDQPVPGASGNLTFGDGNWPIGKHVPVVSVPHQATPYVYITGQ